MLPIAYCLVGDEVDKDEIELKPIRIRMICADEDELELKPIRIRIR